MKSNAVMTVFTVVAFFAAAASRVRSAYVVDHLPDTVPAQDLQRYSFLAEIYNVLYCRNRCPSWRCQDDSAVIHGYCCGCPNSLTANVPVLCAEDLRCPLNMKNLCKDYQFMITCCCTGN